MANKYCNLDGSKKIKDEYQKINIGFDKVEEDVNSIDTRVNNIITTPVEGVSAQEIIDARGGRPVLGKRFEDIETDIEDLEVDLTTHLEDNTPHREAVSIERKNPDDDGIFTLIEFKRPDGTLFKTSQLNGTSPYASRTVRYYDKNENLVQTIEYSITYSNDEVVSEVIISA